MKSEKEVNDLIDKLELHREEANDRGYKEEAEATRLQIVALQWVLK